MRCIPTALGRSSRDQRLRESIEISAITHDDPWCTTSCAAYNEIAAALLDAADPASAVERGLTPAVELDEPKVVEAIRYGKELPLAGVAVTGQTGLEGGGTGLVLDSLSLAVAAVLDVRPFADALVDVVRLGGDTDTNGAIAGGLLGARDGARALPQRWVAVLQFTGDFTAAVDRMTHL